uniref:(northern house mosquito) hypothetical protein n=1 Tax=Culex pipiens TaxID=7175 RepID=A0A8D8H5T8_CULPI
MVIDKDIDLEAGAAALKAWLITQPHLPQNIHPLLLKRYIHSTKGDLEYAKKIFVHGYTIRHNNPHIFGDRDPLEPKVQNVLKAIEYFTDDTRWKIDETRRTSYHKSHGTVELSGSLRKLEID